MELLLSVRDIDVNAQDSKGRTALMAASAKGLKRIMLMLLKVRARGGAVARRSAAPTARLDEGGYSGVIPPRQRAREGLHPSKRRGTFPCLQSTPPLGCS